MIKLPAYFLGFNSKSDGSAGLRFGTQELIAEDFAELKRDQNKFGWLLFQESNFSFEDMPKEPAYEDQKTPSKRQRAALFVLWKQTSRGDFESFYRNYMEEEITKIKSQIDS